nr:hypothetical protein [uncultured Pedobacter sp.]
MEKKSNLEAVVREGVSSNFELGSELFEVAIDSFLEGIIKDIPIVKTLIGFYKGVLGIREANQIKKIMLFFSQLHSGILNQSEKFNFIKKFDEDSDFRQKVTNHIMILNDRFIEEEKSIYFANLLAAHLKGLITYNEYFEISLILETCQMKVFNMLEEFASITPQFIGSNIGEGYVIEQSPFGSLLISSGLIISNNGKFGTATVNFYGVCFYYYAMKAKFDITRSEIKSLTPPYYTLYESS